MKFLTVASGHKVWAVFFLLFLSCAQFSLAAINPVVFPGSTPAPEILKRVKVGENIGSSVAIAPNGDSYVGSRDGNIYKIKGENVEVLLASGSTHPPIGSSPAITPDGSTLFYQYGTW